MKSTTVPILKYLKKHPISLYQVVAGQRRVSGVEAMIADTTSLSVVVQSIGMPRKNCDRIRVQYYSAIEDTIITGNN